MVDQGLQFESAAHRTAGTVRAKGSTADGLISCGALGSDWLIRAEAEGDVTLLVWLFEQKWVYIVKGGIPVDSVCIFGTRTYIRQFLFPFSNNNNVNSLNSKVTFSAVSVIPPPFIGFLFFGK